MICPHCQTQVHNRASVCSGCGAEIVRGATRKERSRIGGIFAFVALIIGLAVMGSSRLPKTSSDGALLVVLGLAAFVVLGYTTGRFVAGLTRSPEPRFLRSYQH